MTPITKDTPVGTRVISATLFRGPLVGINFDKWARIRTKAGDEYVSDIDHVYIDEPAPGTWAWACEQALNNQPTVRDRGRVKLEMVNDTLRLLVRYRDGWDYVDFGRDDLTATDWEIAP